VINSEEFLKLQADQEKFAAQHVELYMRCLGRDSRAGELAFDQEKAHSIALQAKLDSITREHGDAYIEGIQPHFDILKARHFDSSWNWVRQDALLPHVVRHHLCEITARWNSFSFKFAPIAQALYPTPCWLDVPSLLSVPPLLVC